MNADADVDALVAEAVRSIRDRFGSDGLRDLVAMATAELNRTEVVSEEVHAADVADTQAWIAYTGDDD